MERHISQLALFMGETGQYMTDIIIEGVERRLLEQLTQEQKTVLAKTHFHQVDPNGYTPGETVTLLKRLLRESGFYAGTIFLKRTFQCKLYVHDVHELTSAQSYNMLKLYIENIDAIWQKEKSPARIRMESRPSAVFGALENEKQHFLIFELL